MTEAAALSLYTGAILLGALAGGALPFFASVRRSDLLLSFSAGVMLGAAFFHMLPEAVEGGGGAAVPFVLVGFLFLYLLERFVLVQDHLHRRRGGHSPLSRLSDRTARSDIELPRSLLRAAPRRAADGRTVQGIRPQHHAPHHGA
jgi:zinc and cadmium transporter